jgi:hypothetical protein
LATSSNETHTAVLKRQIEELKDHDEILGHLMALPEEDSLELLRQLRTASNKSNMLSTIKGGANTTYRLSDHITIRSVLPTTQSGVEFELSIRHPVAYPTLYPRDVTINLGNFLESMISPTAESNKRRLDDHPWWKQIQLRRHSPTVPLLDTFRAHSASPLRIRRKESSSSASGSKLLSGPSRIPAYCDRRLHQLNLQDWTDSPITNDFAAAAISLYLDTEYRLLPFFDADLFLTGLIHGDHDFCPPFLLMSVLSIACVS